MGNVISTDFAQRAAQRVVQEMRELIAEHTQDVNEWQEMFAALTKQRDELLELVEYEHETNRLLFEQVRLLSDQLTRLKNGDWSSSDKGE